MSAPAWLWYADASADEVLAALRAFLRREVGEDAVRLLDHGLDGVSLRQLAGDQGVGKLTHGSFDGWCDGYEKRYWSSPTNSATTSLSGPSSGY